MAVTRLLAGNAVRRIEHGLASGHRDVEEKVIVAGDEFEHCGNVGQRKAGLEQRGGQLFEQERRGGYVAIVAFVAHVQRLRGERLGLQTAQLGQPGS